MSETFTDRRGLIAAWNRVRGDILQAHGLDRHRKGVRVAAGLIVMDLLIGDRWVLYTDDRPTMCERVDAGGTFRLRARQTQLKGVPA